VKSDGLLLRRELLRATARLGLACGLASAGMTTAPVRAHDELGPVLPRRAAPGLNLTLHDGRKTALPRLLQGRWTALQLMFTGCSGTCPLQGATFAHLQELVLDRLPGAQLLSLTVDPLSDDPARLETWRRSFGARAQWLAAAPPVAHNEVMLDFLQARNDGPDKHRAATYLFDRNGRLAYRCAELAPARDVARSLEQLARLRAG
jgi:protein SCO1/2